MYAVECLVVGGEGSEVVLRHGVVLVVIYTALGKYCFRERILVFGVGVEVGVGVTYCVIFRVDTGAVGHSLVGVILYIMLVGRLLIAVCAERGEVKSFKGSPV